jgi:tRNA pseudouridine32 synthase/23S rRNA pseudouridine746 synthase
VIHPHRAGGPDTDACIRGAGRGLAPRGAAPVELHHADAAWIVIDKPAGLPSVPGRAPGLQDCAASRVQRLFADARVVHRLDMATSGLLVMARGVPNQRSLCAAFEQRQVTKAYVALVSGQPREERGEVALPLAADWPRRPRQVVDHLGGKPALTRWRVIERLGAHARVLLEPLTGRTHQLRVHLAALGHPILGDSLYGDAAASRASPRLALHACRLELAHPASGQSCSFVSPVPF